MPVCGVAARALWLESRPLSRAAREVRLLTRRVHAGGWDRTAAVGRPAKQNLSRTRDPRREQRRAKDLNRKPVCGLQRRGCQSQIHAVGFLL